MSTTGTSRRRRSSAPPTLRRSPRVTFMPGNLTAACSQALTTAAANGFTTGVDPEPVDGQPGKLRVTITATVQNTFGQLLGLTVTVRDLASAPLPCTRTKYVPADLDPPAEGFTCDYSSPTGCWITLALRLRRRPALRHHVVGGRPRGDAGAADRVSSLTAHADLAQPLVVRAALLGRGQRRAVEVDGSRRGTARSRWTPTPRRTSTSPTRRRSRAGRPASATSRR